MTGSDMVLEELVSGLPVSWAAGSRPRPGLEVAGVCHDSRRVEPGDLFVTWKGDNWDGASFVEEAARRGAVAVLTDPRAPVPLLPWLVAPEPRTLLAPLASRVYQHPDRELLMVGVTGTNGKSTTVALIAALLEEAGCPSALLGTLGYRFRDLDFGGERTTPEASDLHRVLRRAHDAGAMAAVMEVSSHALVQGRVDCAAFDLAVFLNLTRDHLDFHPTMEDYFAAKASLFERLEDDGRAVISIDCEWGERLAELHPRALTFGERGAVRFVDLRLSTQRHRGAHRDAARRGRGRVAPPRRLQRAEPARRGRRRRGARARSRGLCAGARPVRAGAGTHAAGRARPELSGGGRLRAHRRRAARRARRRCAVLHRAVV